MYYFTCQKSSKLSQACFSKTKKCVGVVWFGPAGITTLGAVYLGVTTGIVVLWCFCQYVVAGRRYWYGIWTWLSPFLRRYVEFWSLKTELVNVPCVLSVFISIVTAASTLFSFRRLLKTRLFTVFPVISVILLTFGVSSTSLTVLGDLVVVWLFVTVICSFLHYITFTYPLCVQHSEHEYHKLLLPPVFHAGRYSL